MDLVPVPTCSDQQRRAAPDHEDLVHVDPPSAFTEQGAELLDKDCLDKEALKQERMLELERYIERLGGTVPDGWTIKVYLRQNYPGYSGPRVDYEYLAPGGKVARSLCQVARELGFDVPKQTSKKDGAASSAKALKRKPDSSKQAGKPAAKKPKSSKASEGQPLASKPSAKLQAATFQVTAADTDAAAAAAGLSEGDEIKVYVPCLMRQLKRCAVYQVLYDAAGLTASASASHASLSYTSREDGIQLQFMGCKDITYWKLRSSEAQALDTLIASQGVSVDKLPLDWRPQGQAWINPTRNPGIELFLPVFLCCFMKVESNDRHGCLTLSDGSLISSQAGCFALRIQAPAPSVSQPQLPANGDGSEGQVLQNKGSSSTQGLAGRHQSISQPGLISGPTACLTAADASVPSPNNNCNNETSGARSGNGLPVIQLQAIQRAKAIKSKENKKQQDGSDHMAANQPVNELVSDDEPSIHDHDNCYLYHDDAWDYMQDDDHDTQKAKDSIDQSHEVIAIDDSDIEEPLAATTATAAAATATHQQHLPATAFAAIATATSVGQANTIAAMQQPACLANASASAPEPHLQQANVPSASQPAVHQGSTHAAIRSVLQIYTEAVEQENNSLKEKLAETERQLQGLRVQVQQQQARTHQDQQTIVDLEASVQHLQASWGEALKQLESCEAEGDILEEKLSEKDTLTSELELKLRQVQRLATGLEDAAEGNVSHAETQVCHAAVKPEPAQDTLGHGRPRLDSFKDTTALASNSMQASGGVPQDSGQLLSDSAQPTLIAGQAGADPDQAIRAVKNEFQGMLLQILLAAQDAALTDEKRSRAIVAACKKAVGALRSSGAGGKLPADVKSEIYEWAGSVRDWCEDNPINCDQCVQYLMGIPHCLAAFLQPSTS